MQDLLSGQQMDIRTHLSVLALSGIYDMSDIPDIRKKLAGVGNRPFLKRLQKSSAVFGSFLCSQILSLFVTPGIKVDSNIR